MGSNIAVKDVALIKEYFSETEVISRAWLFGSRAKGTHSKCSDIDIAVELTPEDGKSFAEWILHGHEWKDALNAKNPTTPIDLQWRGDDDEDVVNVAVSEHGIPIFDRTKK